MGEAHPIRRLEALVRQHGDDLPLDSAMAAVAAVERPQLTDEEVRQPLDQLAERVSRKAEGVSDGGLDALRVVLFEEAGFAGRRERYYAPENSLIDQVLATRKGIPITLAVVWLEVARRAGLEAEGVGFPGHFLVRHRAGVVWRYVDVFDGGRVLTAADTQQILTTMHGPDARLETSMLEPVSNRALLTRVVLNLKNAYAMADDLMGVVSAGDRLLALDEDLHTERRDRGLAYARLGLASAALADLREYLARADPGRTERHGLEGLIPELEMRAAKMN
ncbi:MAG: transglutaminase-like domain-containing protein [Myxococcota bacterium]